PHPGMPRVKQAVGPIDFDAFMERLKKSVNRAKLDKALKMLKADRFQLFTEVKPDSVLGVVKSQTDKDLVYSCKLAPDRTFACCRKNLNMFGGLNRQLCKHLLVLIIGLARAKQLDPTLADQWVQASLAAKPVLDRDVMSETFIRYKGAEAGEIDWRPTETIPE